MKRIVVYLVLSIIFIVIGITKTSDFVFFELMNLPFVLVGKGLRWLSMTHPALNILAIILYLSIGLLPIIWLIYMLLNNKASVKKLLLVPFSLWLLLVLYFSVNTHELVEHINPILFDAMSVEDYQQTVTLYLSGLIMPLYGLALIYLVMTFIKVSNINIKKTLLLLVDFLIITILAVMLMSKLPSIIDDMASLSNRYDYTVLIVTIIKNVTIISLLGVIVYYTIMSIQSFDIDNRKLARYIHSLYRMTYIYILTVLGFVVLENALKFLMRSMTDSIHFDMAFPLLTLIFAATLLLISKYVKSSNLIKEEHELII